MRLNHRSRRISFTEFAESHSQKRSNITADARHWLQCAKTLLSWLHIQNNTSGGRLKRPATLRGVERSGSPTSSASPRGNFAFWTSEHRRLELCQKKLSDVSKNFAYTIGAFLNLLKPVLGCIKTYCCKQMCFLFSQIFLQLKKIISYYLYVVDKITEI